jgi:hypothetical protein
MSIIDPDYFKRFPKHGEEDLGEYVEFIKDYEVKNSHNKLFDALEKELESRQKIVSYYVDDYYVAPIEPLDSSFALKPQKKTGDHSFNEICSMEMDSFHYWLKEASIEELEIFGRFTTQSKPRKRKRNIIQLLLGTVQSLLTGIVPVSRYS